MRRIATIAANELSALVRTKFFVAGLFFMPALMLVLLAFFNYAGAAMNRADRRFAVIDGTGVLYAPIAAAAEAHNGADDPAARRAPTFVPSLVDPAGRSADDVETELSAEVRAKTIVAFIEIPASVLDNPPTAVVKYYGGNAADQSFNAWLSTTLNGAIADRRLARAGLDAALVSRLTRPVRLAAFGLVERGADGQTTVSREVSPLERVAVPIFLTVLMFMAVMSTAQHLIHSIIEEKMSRISEVLLGSVTAFQLLMGKLLGIVAVSLMLGVIYLAGGAYALLAMARPDLIQPALIGWFLVFLLCATCLFGSLFQALSSACADLKDAQSMLQPAMMIVIGAYATSIFALRAPDSPIVVLLSMIPVTAPFLMMMRLAVTPGPPVWQVIASISLLAGTTVAVVWAAGRIFRVGLLMQGKPPNLPELMRWIRL